VLITALIAPWFVVTGRTETRPDADHPYTLVGETVNLISWKDIFCYEDSPSGAHDFEGCPAGSHFAWRKSDWCKQNDCADLSKLYWGVLGLICASILFCIFASVSIFKRCCSIKTSAAVLGRNRVLIAISVLGFLTTLCAVSVFGSLHQKAMRSANYQQLCDVPGAKETPCNHLWGSLTVQTDANTRSKLAWIPGGWIAGASACLLWLFVIYFSCKPVTVPNAHTQHLNMDMTQPMIEPSVEDYMYY